MEYFKEFLTFILMAFCLIFFVFTLIGPMFGIAALVDTYSEWLMLLYIPWLMFFKKTTRMDVRLNY